MSNFMARNSFFDLKGSDWNVHISECLFYSINKQMVFEVFGCDLMIFAQIAVLNKLRIKILDPFNL